ncbi:MAG: thermonuclease family protein [Rhodospirillales bacterium]|nr:thermonuclease family protein [Rhodospirillales bacterium]MDP6804802.1 thermonuclease family protein [Rhodospirillales bacterium]
MGFGGWPRRIVIALVRSVATLWLLGAAGAMTPTPAFASPPDTIDGPILATVLRIIDGDTIMVSARIWLGQRIETQVRLDGADAPEIRGRCAHERDLAVRARAFAVARLGGRTVRLRDIRFGKYAGRVVARVELAAGRDFAQDLIAAGLARPYGGGARISWCTLTRPD